MSFISSTIISLSSFLIIDVPCPVHRNFDGKFLVDKKGVVRTPGNDIEREIQELLDEEEL